MSMQIVSPASNAGIEKGTEFPVHGEQQTHPEDPGDRVTLQFSGEPDGPWTTCRSIGGGGALEANEAPWTSQSSTFDIAKAKLHIAGVWARAAVFAGSVEGTPVSTGDTIYWRGITSVPGEPSPR